MRLERLELKRALFGQNANKIVGHITVSGEHGRVDLNISPDQAKQIIDICADSLVAAARETAGLMVADIIDAHAVVEIE